MTARFVDVGDVPVRAMRVGFVGEPGYELYARVEFGVALWRTLWEAGRERGLVAGGSRARGLAAAGVRAPGLGRGHLARRDAVRGRPGASWSASTRAPFVGREALQRARRAGPPASLLRCLVLDDPRAVALGREPVRMDGTVPGAS